VLVAAIEAQESVRPSATNGAVLADWRKALIDCLSERGRQWIERFDNMLYRRTIDGLLLRCLGDDEAMIAMGEMHAGMCGAHQPTHKMRWALRRAGMYWPTMLQDCFRYYKGCEACQKFGRIQAAPESMLIQL
jgi:hypothetical protein